MFIYDIFIFVKPLLRQVLNFEKVISCYLPLFSDKENNKIMKFCTHPHTHRDISQYIYIYRERERESKDFLFFCLFVQREKKVNILN